MHKLRIQVFVEKKTGSGIERIAVSNPWERPAANLVGVPLLFSNISTELTGLGNSLWKKRSHELIDIASNAETFIPMFNGGQAPGAMAFDLSTGVVINPADAASASAGVFKQLAKNTAVAGGALAGLGTESKPGFKGKGMSEIISQYIEFTLVAPGGKETVHKRWVLPPPKWRSSKKPGLYLSRRYTMMVDVGALPDGYVADIAFERMIREGPLVRSVVEVVHGKELSISNQELKLVPTEWAGRAEMVSMLNRSRDQLGWRSEPAIHLYMDELDPSEKDEIDIVWNPRRAVKRSAEGVVPDPRSVVMAGVWETRAEALLGGRGKVPIDSAGAKLSNSNIQSNQYLIISPKQPEFADHANVDARAVAMIKRDLEAGYIVVMLPTDNSNGEAAWWRVNPLTGETLGIRNRGTGSVSVEFMETMSMSFTALGAVIGTGACLAETSGASGVICCITLNAAIAGTGYGIGYGLAAEWGALFGMIYDGVSFGGGLVMPNICSGL